MATSGHVDSWYAATARAAPRRAALSEALEADVCVVGGGFTGISTALNLAERGYDVVLLEAQRIGWGASGRNGGQIGSAYSTDMSRIEAWVGRDDARKLWDMAEEAKEIIAERVARHEIACDLKWGYLLAAPKARQLRALAEVQERWSRVYGYEKTRLVEGEAIRRHVNSHAYVGGLLDDGAGQLHPLNYCLGLAAAAETAGARLFEGSEVSGIERSRRPVVHCALGSVTADFVVLAGNAYLGDLAPKLRRKVMPVGTYIGATNPLGENRARSLIPDDIAVCDVNFVLNYYRLSADHRMLFGGRVSYSGLMPPNLPAAMRKKMLEVFPGLSDTAFDYTWGGDVAITPERTPHFGRIAPNIYFAQGFSGHGVALTGLAGKVIAEAIAGQAERFDVFTRLPHKDFPGGRYLRTPTLALAMTWFRLRDLLP